MIKLADMIRSLMRANRINQRELAIQSGVPYSTLNSILKSSDNARIQTAVRLAEFFHVTLDFLVTGEETEQQGDADLLAAYHAHPDLQPAVDRLLGVVRQPKNDTAGDDLADVLSAFTQAAAISK